MDPLTLALGVGTTAVVGLGTGLRLRRRLRRAEAAAARLRLELEAEQYAANHDPLTGLLNRRAFYRLGHRMVVDPTRPATACVVMDINSFKQINDTLGHAAGDEVLITVARRLAQYGSAGADRNLVARLGGDEFAGVFSYPTTDWFLLYPAAEALAELLAAPMPVAGRHLRVTTAVGVSAVTRDGGLTLALRQADSAMYRAKATHSQAACYNPVLDNPVLDNPVLGDDTAVTSLPGPDRRHPELSMSLASPVAVASSVAESGARPAPAPRPPTRRVPVEAAPSRGAW